MEKPDAVAALAALAQDSRLDVFRLLVQAGLDGLPAGQVAAKLEACAQHADVSFRPAARCRAGDGTARRPLDDLCDAVRDHERARAIPHRELLSRFQQGSPSGAQTCPPEECAPPAICKPARGKRAKIPV